MHTGGKLVPLHACERALERYGLTISAGELRLIEDRLSRGEGMILRRDTTGDDVRVIRVCGLLATVVCMKDGRIKTFLPSDAPYKKKGWRWVA